MSNKRLHNQESADCYEEILLSIKGKLKLVKQVLGEDLSNKRSKIDVEGHREWADLHGDILLLIKAKLKIVDQLRFRAVCRNWHSVPYLKSADKLPWILVFRRLWKNDKSVLKSNILYDPSNSREYILGDELIRPDAVITRNVNYSKLGWVFLASTLITGDCKLSLYHVFTRTTIDLPALRTKYGGKATFSTIPTCSDCVFCVTHNGRVRADELSISIYRTGDVGWRTFNLKAPGLSEVQDLFYMKENFFFVFNMGSVLAFDIVSHDWWQVTIDTSQIMNVQLEFEGQKYIMKMIASNGEVILVYFCRNWKPWYIFKLDWSLMAWVTVATLGNRTLFLGDTSLSIPTVGEIKSLAGHIHFRNKFRFHHYSFKNNGSHKSSKLRALVNKYYSNFEKIVGDFNWVWVEPHS